MSKIQLIIVTMSSDLLHCEGVVDEKFHVVECKIILRVGHRTDQSVRTLVFVRDKENVH